MKATILLVEDSERQGRDLVQALRALDYSVDWVRTGAEGMQHAKAGAVDLVLLDVGLDDVDGFSVCRWLKAEEKTRVTPVIMLTARDQLRDKVLGLNLGANDYLLKPFDPAELDARIYVALRAQAKYTELLQRNGELEAMLQDVEQLATTDALTGVCNRRRFEDVLQREFAATKRYGHDLCCVLLDMDHFKRVNDQFGHAAGDVVLKRAAKCLEGALREMDLVARYGGEEFALLLPHTSVQGCFVAITRLAETLRTELLDVLDVPVSLTASFGIASVDIVRGDDFNALVKAADVALYRAKQNGRNRVEIYSKALEPPASELDG